MESIPPPLHRRQTHGIENVMKGLPGHEHGRCRNIADKLIREGLLVRKKTSYGLQVSLNKARIKEIKQILGVP